MTWLSSHRVIGFSPLTSPLLSNSSLQLCFVSNERRETGMSEGETCLQDRLLLLLMYANVQLNVIWEVCPVQD